MATSSSPQPQPVSTRLMIAVIAVALFGAFLRLYSLDYMAFHHDESIHAYYAHQIYKGQVQSYKYDPTYHGPFLYHYGALFFILFGDSDTAARLPFVSFGLLMMYFVWRMRPWLGNYGALFAMGAVALSPTLSYFSRFARNDIYIAAAGLGVILYALEYLRDRKHSQLVAIAFWLSLMYCIKENSYMSGFFMGSFIVFYGVYHVWSMVSEGRRQALADIFVERAPFVKLTALYALFSCAAFSLVWFVTRGFEGAYPKSPSPGLSLNHMINLRIAWNEYIADHGWVYPFWIVFFTSVAVMVFLGLAWARTRLEAAPSDQPFLTRLARNNIGVLTAVFVAVAVYSFLFTTMGYNPGGMKAGVIDYLLYWMGQQDNPRITGSPAYFLPRLALYETSAVLVAFAAYLIYSWRAFGPALFIAFQVAVAAGVGGFFWIAFAKDPNVATTLTKLAVALLVGGAALVGGLLLKTVFSKGGQDDDGAPDDGDNRLSPDGLRAFFIYWSIGAIMIYALLQEKVPWLAVHQALPLCLLAGVFLGDVFARFKPGIWRNVFIVMIVVFAAYQARTSILLNFYNPDNPRELMVYTQSDHSVVQIMDEVERAAQLLGPEYRPPQATKPIIKVQSEPASWPYMWYLRNYFNAGLADGQLPPEDIPFAIVNPSMESRMIPWAKGKYVKQRLPHRAWWPYGQSELPFEYYRRNGGTLTDALGALWRYVLRRELWNPMDPRLRPGSEDVLFYRRDPIVDPEEAPDLPAGYDQDPRPMQVTAQVGQLGSNPGEFNSPRGVALSPDESRLYVLDALNARVQVFDTQTLTHIASWGGPGLADGEFSVPGIAVYGNGPSGGIGTGPDGTVYVTDTWYFNESSQQQGRIVRFSPEGEALPSIVPQNDRFYFPRGLALDNQGILYVADTGNHRVVRFAPNGTYLGVFINEGIREPVGIVCGDNGSVFVADVEGKRVVTANGFGQIVRDRIVYGWTPKSNLALTSIEPYLALDPVGNLLVTDSSTDMIHAFRQTEEAVVLIGGPGAAPGRFRSPKGIAVDSKYQIYVADSLNHRVVKGLVR